MFANSLAPAKSWSSILFFSHIPFSCLAYRLTCLQPSRLQEFIHNPSQIGLDHSEFSGQHGDFARKIVDHLPDALNLLGGPSLGQNPGLRQKRQWTQPKAIAATRGTANPLAAVRPPAPRGRQRLSTPV